MDEASRGWATVGAARDTLSRVLERLELADYLFAIEPAGDAWDVRIECRCLEGSHVSRFELEAGLLEGYDRDPRLRGRLLMRLQERLADCTRSARRVARPAPAAPVQPVAMEATGDDDDPDADDDDPDATTLGALSQYSATAGGSQPSRPQLLSPRPDPHHPLGHFDTPDPFHSELHWYALEQATQDPHPPDADLASPEEGAMHLTASGEGAPAEATLDTPLTLIMTHDVQVVTPDTALGSIRSLFEQSDIHHLAVVDGERLVGIVSHNDMLRLGGGQLDQGHRLTARHIMQDRPIAVRDDANVRDAVDVLGEGVFHGLPVVDARGRLCGMVTSTDLIRFLAKAAADAAN